MTTWVGWVFLANPFSDTIIIKQSNYTNYRKSRHQPVSAGSFCLTQFLPRWLWHCCPGSHSVTETTKSESVHQFFIVQFSSRWYFSSRSFCKLCGWKATANQAYTCDPPKNMQADYAVKAQYGNPSGEQACTQLIRERSSALVLAHCTTLDWSSAPKSGTGEP